MGVFLLDSEDEGGNAVTGAENYELVRRCILLLISKKISMVFMLLILKTACLLYVLSLSLVLKQ